MAWTSQMSSHNMLKSLQWNRWIKTPARQNADLVQNLGRKTQAWYLILHGTSPLRCFFDHMFIYRSAYFLLICCRFIAFCSIDIALVLSCRAPLYLFSDSFQSRGYNLTIKHDCFISGVQHSRRAQKCQAIAISYVTVRHSQTVISPVKVWENTQFNLILSHGKIAATGLVGKGGGERGPGRDERKCIVQACQVGLFEANLTNLAFF